MEFKTEFISNDYSFESKFNSSECGFNTQFGEMQQIGGGTNDYEKLKNKPSINGATLISGMKLSDIGIRTISNLELEEILK